jgi:hypothetical protein
MYNQQQQQYGDAPIPADSIVGMQKMPPKKYALVVSSLRHVGRMASISVDHDQKKIPRDLCRRPDFRLHCLQLRLSPWL